MRFHYRPSLLFVLSMTFSAMTNAAALSGVVAAGGGIDDLSLVIRGGDGQEVIVYCNGNCGDWFDADEASEGQQLKTALVGKSIALEYQTEVNGGRIAGPGDDEPVNLLVKAQLQP